MHRSYGLVELGSDELRALRRLARAPEHLDAVRDGAVLRPLALRVVRGGEEAGDAKRGDEEREGGQAREPGHAARAPLEEHEHDPELGKSDVLAETFRLGVCCLRQVVAAEREARCDALY